MPKSEFTPKLGRPRSRSTDKPGRVTRVVVKAATRRRSSKSPWANALTKRPVAELGRGKGALYQLATPPAGWRRVIVKVRIARHGASDLGAARSHQHYITRDGVTRAGGPGQLYDREQDVADGGGFQERQKGDTYQFRMIVAAEDGARLRDLKPFVRDLMIKMERDLHTKLDWIAADHFNTGHPHTHIIIAGHDDQGQDLVMARHYISHGIRHRARDLVTFELGPELAFERAVKLANEVKAERFTSIDYGIVTEARNNVLVISARDDGDRQREAWRIGRLRHLETMGLAKEPHTGVWHIDNDLQAKLRSLGERGDIMVAMQKVMRAHGMDRPAGDFAIFPGAPASAPVIGRVLRVGIADEMTDRKFLVVDGVDGRLHYAVMGKLAGQDAPEAGVIVALTGGGEKAKMQSAHVKVLSHWPLERLPDAQAATWLDKAIVEDKIPVLSERGFGAQVATALGRRADWLAANGHAIIERPGTVTPNLGMLRDLDRLAESRLASQLSEQLDRVYRPAAEGERITGKHIHTVELPSARLAVIAGRTDFTLVSWRKDLALFHGKDISVTVHDRAITLALARGRDLGLSR